MEQSIWTDFVAKQAPVIIVLAIFCYGMYKYFIQQQNKKDEIIKAKDDRIDEQQDKVMDLYGKAVESQNRGNVIQEQLLAVLKETKEEINKLSDKIK